MATLCGLSNRQTTPSPPLSRSTLTLEKRTSSPREPPLNLGVGVQRWRRRKTGDGIALRNQNNSFEELAHPSKEGCLRFSQRPCGGKMTNDE